MSGVTGVETDAGNDTAVTGADDTVLTGGETNLDSGAAVAAPGDDANVPGDDTGTIGDDTGNEGRQTPPDTYADFEMPEGIQLDESALAQASPLFKELGLSQEQAQKVVSLYADQVKASSQKQLDNFNQLMNDWKDQSKNDSEFGGDKYDENVKIAQHAVSKYGTPELKELLNEHGLGNHPEMIRFMVKVGRTLGEDVPGSDGGAYSKPQDRVSQMYPNSSK